LLAGLEASKVPASPINTVGEVFSDPQIIDREIEICPEGVPGVRAPIRFGTSSLSLDRTAPMLGEHNDLVQTNGWSISAGEPDD
jgi:crotonobetainyl-CoA:carnitine CoA-transferase CaiB-like acyl-CoA transferase